MGKELSNAVLEELLGDDRLPSDFDYASEKQFYDPNQPRDPAGTSTGGQWTSTDGADGSIAGVPGANLSTFPTLQDAVKRGALKIGVKELDKSRWDARYELTVTVDKPEGWEVAERRGRIYDPTKISYEDEYTPKFSPEVKLHLEDVVGDTGGDLFRGMSYEEFQAAKERGYFESRGEYNLGDEQKGLTYFSTDPAQAAHYSSGFAPWAYIATPDRPSFVVRIADPGTSVQTSGAGSAERGVPGRISFNDVKAIYTGDVIEFTAGTVDITVDKETGKVTEGSRLSPSAVVSWTERDVKKFYDPNQPRDPAGTSTGGQWTSTGAAPPPVPPEIATLKTDDERTAYLMKKHGVFFNTGDGTVDSDIANRIVAEVDRLKTELPWVPLSGVILGRPQNSSPDGWAWANDKTIWLNPKWFGKGGDRAGLFAEMAQSVATNWHDSMGTVESLIAHEYGHAVHFALQRTPAAFREDAWARASGLGVVSDTTNMFMMSNLYTNDHVSGYAGTNDKEWFAETFAAARHGSSKVKASRPVKAMNSFLKGVGTPADWKPIQWLSHAPSTVDRSAITGELTAFAKDIGLDPDKL